MGLIYLIYLLSNFLLSNLNEIQFKQDTVLK